MNNNQPTLWRMLEHGEAVPEKHLSGQMYALDGKHFSATFVPIDSQFVPIDSQPDYSTAEIMVLWQKDTAQRARHNMQIDGSRFTYGLALNDNGKPFAVQIFENGEPHSLNYFSPHEIFNYRWTIVTPTP